VFINSLSDTERRALLSKGAMAAYKLSCLCTLVAAYDIARCLDLKRRVEFESGFEKLSGRLRKLKTLMKRPWLMFATTPRWNSVKLMKRPPKPFGKPTRPEKKLKGCLPLQRRRLRDWLLVGTIRRRRRSKVFIEQKDHRPPKPDEANLGRT
jgi:hypothetical protein